MEKKEEIRKYFEGTLSSAEAEKVEDWIVENIESKELDSTFLELLSEGGEDIDEKKTKHAFEMLRKNRLSKRPFINKWLFRAAAAVIVGVLMCGAYFYGHRQGLTSLSAKETYSTIGDFNMVILPDSTRIYLKPESRISYDKVTFKTDRRLYLSGEAYAEVAKDAEHPFILNCQDMTIRVLGTRFNVQAYNEDSESEVILYEGSVNLQTEYNKVYRSIIMNPGNIVKIDKATGELKTYDVPNVNRGKDGTNFYFVDKKLDDIVNQLERHFNKKIKINNNSLQEKRYYAIFANNESLEQIFNSLNASNNMKITYKDDNTIEIK